MADNDEVPEAPMQSQAVRDAILQKSSAGANTAIGVIREQEKEGGLDRIQNLESRGSTQPIAGGDIKPDGIEGAAPVGAQTQPALLATNGTLPVNHIGSPSGPVPISAVEGDPARGAKMIQEQLDSSEKEVLRTGYARLSREKIESMSAADLRAVASDRGYNLGSQAGNRQTRVRFRTEQEKDSNFESDAEVGAGETGAQP